MNSCNGQHLVSRMQGNAGMSTLLPFCHPVDKLNEEQQELVPQRSIVEAEPQAKI